MSLSIAPNRWPGRLIASWIAAASTWSLFVAAHVGLHMRGRNEPHFMSKFDQCPPPMMRRRARLHRHYARRQLGEERDQLAAREFARHNDLALRVDCVNLKHPLRQIETDPRDSLILARLAHGWLPFRWVDDNDHLGTLMPFGAARPPHHSYAGRQWLSWNPYRTFAYRQCPTALLAQCRSFLDEDQKAPYNPAKKRLQIETDGAIDELHPKGREHEP